MLSYTVCLSVYSKDKPSDFFEALQSVYNQTLKPNEIVLVVDGPISCELESVINIFSQQYFSIKILRFKENRGHAAARQAGLDNASNELVAIMDSDDMALPERFEKQISFLANHPEVDIVGGQITEFIEREDNIVGKRTVPETDKEIKDYLKSRCPMNLVTIMARKSSIQKVGGYIDWYCEEDYYLWIRMALANCTFANLPDTLVNVRVGKEMYSRRGGWKYFRSEARLQRYMLTHKVISFPRYFYNVSVRFVLQALLPNSVRGWVFQNFARS